MMTDDMELVREYVARQSETAFETLVSRHINLVYSSALRQVHDAQLAEEITQAVFIILSRKAGSLGLNTVLSAWLYRTTRYASADALKSQRRRQWREQEAHMQSKILNEQTDPAWERLSPLLDEAMARLGERDRSVLVLRFFENKTAREIAAVQRVDESAAQKRVSRALDKLRSFFYKRGITLSAAAIAGAVSANSVHAAPIGLSTTVVATAAKGSAAAASTLTLVKGALKIMAWTKAKTAIVTGAAVIFTAAIVTPTVTHYYHRSNATPTLPVPGGTIAPSEDLKTADEATRAIFEAWGKGDWNAFYANFGEPGVSRDQYEKLFDDRIKNAVAGLEIVSLGKPTNSFGPNLWFVPYKIRFSNGQEKEFRLHVAQDPRTKRWYFKGGF